MAFTLYDDRRWWCAHGFVPPVWWLRATAIARERESVEPDEAQDEGVRRVYVVKWSCSVVIKTDLVCETIASVVPQVLLFACGSHPLSFAIGRLR